MRRIVRPILCCIITFSSALFAQAQNDRFAYAITDETPEGSSWNVLRKLDLQTGQYSAVLLNGSNVNAVVYSAATKKQLLQQPDARFGTLLQAPFGTGVAAAAYDKKHNRLYFTPMFIDQLRYIDLATMKVFYVNDKAFTSFGNAHNNEAKCITRMVITPDGNGYAISNDGNTLIQFTTAKKTSITVLGGLTDNVANGEFSIHNRLTSYGGDMISDDRGNLYLLSANNQVFKINIESKVATYLGAVKGLPASFTINGAAVNADGNLIVSSAIDGTSYYVVHPKTWEASAYSAPVVFRSSDLANSNFLVSATNKFNEIETIAVKPSLSSKGIQVYPNPVTTANFNLQFTNVPVGNYFVKVTDVLGKLILQKNVAVNAERNFQIIPLASSKMKGVYVVSVADNSKKPLFAQKVLVQ